MTATPTPDSTSFSGDIRAYLERSVARAQRQLDVLLHISTRWSRARLAIAIVGALGVTLAWQSGRSGTAWAIALGAIIVFIVFVRLHGRILRGIRAHRLFMDIKRMHVARLDIDWAALPEAMPVPVDGSHPFAADLNLVGPRSVHHLMDTALSQDGSRELARWLLEPDNTEHRQQLVRELKDLPAFRDRIALVSGLVTRTPGERFDGQVLLDWLNERRESARVVPVLRLLAGMAVLNIALYVLHGMGIMGAWWLVSLVAYVGVYLMNSRLYGHLFDDAEHLYYQLLRFRPVLQRIETFRFHRRPALAALCAPLQVEQPVPSVIFKRLLKLSIAASAQKNEVFRVVVNLLMPWDLYYAHRLEGAKDALRGLLPVWLRTWRELEAASSLANWAGLHPDATFPEVGTGRTLEATALGHPLIPERDRVRNDFALNGPGHVVLVTGSNMSGKSTFLRTIGVSVALAHAGGAVDAARFVLPPVRLFSSINVADSVNDGISYFYAEVKRLRALLTTLVEADAPPLLFLVDEIFRGTNNRERFIGGRSVIEALKDGPGMGLVTTHDLELVDIGGLDNQHFREHIEDGRMTFDYQLRTGPCPTTNALAIMEMEGLPVRRDP